MIGFLSFLHARSTATTGRPKVGTALETGWTLQNAANATNMNNLFLMNFSFFSLYKWAAGIKRSHRRYHAYRSSNPVTSVVASYSSSNPMAERQRGSTTLQMAHQDGGLENNSSCAKIKNWEKKRKIVQHMSRWAGWMWSSLGISGVCVLVVLLISYVHVSCNPRFGPLLVYAIAVQCV